MLLAGLILAVTAAAAPAQSQLGSFAMPAGPSARTSATGSSAVLVRQHAVLTPANRATGMPNTTEPGRRLKQVRVEIQPTGQGTSEPTYFVQDSFAELEGMPQGDPDATVNLGLGHRTDTTCDLAAVISEQTSDFGGDIYEFVGYNPTYFPTPSRPWDCVAAFVDDSNGGAPTVTYDAFVAPLTDVRESPRLKIKAVRLLGQKKKKLKLVRGIPTQIEIKVRNAGKVPSGKLTVKGKGKGLSVTSRRLDAVGKESDRSGSVKVRLKGARKRTKLRIVATDGSVRSAVTLKVVRVKPPRRPAVGSYRDKSGRIKFTVRRGKIIGWRGSMGTRCGGYPDLPTYTFNTYSFRTVKIPRNGIVQAVERGELYSASLRLRIVGGKVSRGLFSYGGPDRCAASATFTARRTGR